MMNIDSHRHGIEIRRLPLLLLAFFILFVLASAFHYHADGILHHDDCPICVSVNHLLITFENTVSLDVPLQIIDALLHRESLNYSFLQSIFTPLRAPPF